MKNVFRLVGPRTSVFALAGVYNLVQNGTRPARLTTQWRVAKCSTLPPSSTALVLRVLPQVLKDFLSRSATYSRDEARPTPALTRERSWRYLATGVFKYLRDTLMPPTRVLRRAMEALAQRQTRAVKSSHNSKTAAGACRLSYFGSGGGIEPPTLGL